MLTQLTINNFAIVRQLEIELAKGMSVITGEPAQGNLLLLMRWDYVWGSVLKPLWFEKGRKELKFVRHFLLNQLTPLINGCKSKNCKILIIPPIVFYVVSLMQMGVRKPLSIARPYRLPN